MTNRDQQLAVFGRDGSPLTPPPEDLQLDPIPQVVGPTSTPAAPAATLRRSTRGRKPKRRHEDSGSDVDENDDLDGDVRMTDTQTEKKPPMKRIKLSEYQDVIGQGTSRDPILIDVEPRSIWQVEETTVCEVSSS